MSDEFRPDRRPEDSPAESAPGAERLEPRPGAPLEAEASGDTLGGWKPATPPPSATAFPAPGESPAAAPWGGGPKPSAYPTPAMGASPEAPPPCPARPTEPYPPRPGAAYPPAPPMAPPSAGGYGPPPPAAGGWGAIPRGPAAPPPPAPGYGAPGGGYPPPPGGYAYGPYGPPPAAGGPGWRAVPPRAPKSGGGLKVLLIAALIFLALGVIGVIAAGNFLGGGSSPSMTFGGDRIGVLDVEGVLGQGEAYRYEAETGYLISVLRKWSEDTAMKGLIVRINSPGGAVGATQELVNEIERYKRKTRNPVVASFGDIAASGGYYTATACDEIIANPGTLTGSIGVILNFANFQGLQEKIGVRFQAIKSGEFKDIGSGSRPMTEEERALLQTMIDDVQQQFVGAVKKGRGRVIREILAERRECEPADITEADLDAYLETLTDGRIFSGAQALEAGLVDRLGPMRAAVERVKTLQNLKGDPKLVSSRRVRTLFDSFSGETRAALRQMAPGQVSLEYRFSLP